MRVTGGAARGRTLRAPRGSSVRPTGGKVRGAIFNMLAARTAIERRRLLDLFCGTGALGIEALSRGAAYVTFVDESRLSCAAARENLERSGFRNLAEVRQQPVAGALRRLAEAHAKFGGVFMDPPYRRGLAARSLEALGRGELLEDDAWIVVEHASDEPLEESFGILRRESSRRYGSTAVSLYWASPT